MVLCLFLLLLLKHQFILWCSLRHLLHLWLTGSVNLLLILELLLLGSRNMLLWEGVEPLRPKPQNPTSKKWVLLQMLRRDNNVASSCELLVLLLLLLLELNLLLKGLTIRKPRLKLTRCLLERIRSGHRKVRERLTELTCIQVLSGCCLGILSKSWKLRVQNQTRLT